MCVDMEENGTSSPETATLTLRMKPKLQRLSKMSKNGRMCFISLFQSETEYTRRVGEGR